ncbi:MAG: hypothetical protein R6W86_13675, partial [Marinobacter sp.]|uniref:hypothetical protein n=1 Tax=Marinobacter sp. TaxID=50741 RepID=UPI00396D356D
MALASVVVRRLKTGLSLATVWRLIWCSGLGAIRRIHWAISAYSVFWFLAQLVKLLQGIGSRHSALGAKSKTKGKQALNKSQQYAAYGRRTPFPWLLRRHSKGAAVLRR